MAHFDYVSPCGVLRISGTDGTLQRVRLLRRRGAGKPGSRRPPRALAPFVEKLDVYFSGQAIECDLARLSFDGASRFERKVYEALASVPYGQVVTYAELARMSGSPRASRAVGSALGKNPLPVFIPCHRVIRADRSMGGFGAGTTWKRRLLQHEGLALRRGRVVAPSNGSDNHNGG